MKLCTFEVATHIGRQRRLGAAVAEGIVDLNFAAAREHHSYTLADALVPPTMRGLLDGGARAMHFAHEALSKLPAGASKGERDETIRYKWQQVSPVTPLPDPRSIRDFFSFEQHVKIGFERRGEPMPQEWYEIPVYYQTGHHNLLGTDQDVIWPGFTEKFDYELELAAIIGKPGRNIRAADAREYIAGYTILNDFSARDIQRREMKVRLGPAKGKHWASALGPWMVTADEISQPYSLNMLARVNGEQWSSGNSRDMHWSFEQMIEFISQDDTIYPGDIIGSGTVGSGCGLELDRWVQPGDTIELEIEKIGVLRNRVVRPKRS